MSAADPPVEAERSGEAKRWLTVAREDLRVARMCLSMEIPALGAAAYHCQQASEKVLKGMLVVSGVAFGRTHDLDELASLAAPHFPACAPLLDTVRPQTVWGVAYRYPSTEDLTEPEPSDTELREALATVDQLAAHLRSMLNV